MANARALNIRSNAASQTFQTQLGESLVRIDLFWSDVTQGWYVNIRDLQGKPICLLRRLTTETPVTGQRLVDLKGQLYPMALSTPAQDIGREPWGSTHDLYYLEEV